MIQKVLLFLLPLLLFSCKEDQKDTEQPKETRLIFKPEFDGLDAFMNYRQKVEARKDLKRLPSLSFTHKTGYSLQSVAFLDPKGEILKATLDQIDTNGHKLTYTFYFLKEVLSMAQVIDEQLRLSNLQYKETFYFYNANQSPIACYTRKVVNGKQSPYLSKAPDSKENQTIEDCLQMLSNMQNQTAQFSLSFQGFDEAFNKKFVQFGNDYYSTNLAYAPTDPMIIGFEKNPEAFKNQTFTIQFQDVQEASGLQYQVLTDIQAN
ncbi:MAG: hypothetical protein LW804_00755 [Cryomorphaceae bacterium]|nr:hypothetical protein [Cryomorphaceae bacterium]